MKEQTPIYDSIQDLVGDAKWNDVGVIETTDLIMDLVNTKVLEALEREVPKAFDSYPLTKLDIKTGKQYFETKVKPEYE